MKGTHELFSTSIDAKWHTLFLDVLENERGRWLQIAETRPNGLRQSVAIDEDRWTDFQRELLKATSVVGSRLDSAEVAKNERARAYDPWPAQDDEVIRFLFRIGSGIGAIAAALQRERSAVRSRLRHLELEVHEA